VKNELPDKEFETGQVEDFPHENRDTFQWVRPYQLRREKGQCKGGLIWGGNTAGFVILKRDRSGCVKYIPKPEGGRGEGPNVKTKRTGFN